jgi:glycosyltransferase involved in cell wall biosynthesis
MESESFVPLVQVRTPTYKRPDALRRCLKSLQAQSWKNWVCDVFDDDPSGSGEAVCAELADSRIVYTRNPAQNFASKNIDKCFSSANPRDADYFCIVEDDNFLLPMFMEENIRICMKTGVKLVLRNQLVEHASGTENVHLSTGGVLDEMFREGIYKPEQVRLSLMAGIGVSNGGLFWSRHAISDLEIGFTCTATIQEYMRTFSILDDLYVAMQPLAVWAENGEQTTRDLGGRAGYLRRELDLKRAIQRLQREVWQTTPENDRRTFLNTDLFSTPAKLKARALAKALIPARSNGTLGVRDYAEMVARGLLIRTVGRVPGDFEDFIASRRKPVTRALADSGGDPVALRTMP